MADAPLSKLTLPHLQDAGAGGIALQWTADATVGVVLSFVREKTGTATDFPLTTSTNHDGKLWQVTCTTRDGSQVLVEPKDATTFQAWDASAMLGLSGDSSAVLLEWDDVPVPGATDEDAISVQILCRLDAGSTVANLWTTVARKRGASAGIDLIEAPILSIKGPALPQGSETHLDGQKRARVLVPGNNFTFMPQLAQNTPLWHWASNGYAAIPGHPNPGLPHQLVAVASLNADTVNPDPAYRKMVVFGSEDTEGFLKSYRIQGLSQSDEGWLRVGLIHYAEWEDLLSGGGGERYANQCAIRYPAMIGAIRAKDDAWWWDACDLYRTRMLARGGPAAPPPIEQSQDLQSDLTRKPSLYIASIRQHLFSSLKGKPYYQDLLDRQDLFARALSDAAQKVESSFLHLQTWLTDTTGVSNPDNPVRDSVDDGLPDIVKEAGKKDHRVTVYTRPWDLPETSGWNPPGFKSVVNGAIQIDLSNPDFPSWWADRITSELARLGFRGQYMDSVGGGRQINTEIGQNGGKHLTEGKRALAKAVRAAFGPQSCLATEAAEEGVTHLFDIAQEGYTWHPTHLMLAEDTVIPAMSGVSDLPIRARWMNPPLWAAIWHDRYPTRTIAFNDHNCLLGTNADWFPKGSAAGLSAAEMRDLYCWLAAAVFIVGQQVGMGQIQHDFYESDPDVQTWSGKPNTLVARGPNGTPTIDSAKDPNRAGFDVLSYLRVLIGHQSSSSGGPYLLTGRYLRPLNVDLSSAANSKSPNPVAVCTDARVAYSTRSRYLVMLPFLYAVSYGAGLGNMSWVTGSFQVPDVLSSLWENSSGTVALVLTNWTDANASFLGELDASLYSSIPSTFQARRVAKDGTRTTLATGLSGKVTIGDSASGAAIDLGTIAPRSVQIVEFVS